MNLKDIKFPQYRKYSNGLSYFKIISAKEMIEVRRVGKKLIITELLASQLPELNYIYDLLIEEDRAITIEADEFENLLKEL